MKVDLGMSASGSRIDELLVDRIELGATDTPLHALDRLRAEIPDAPRLWIKRDDVMPRAAGGNKLRKLEYLLRDAKQEGATAVATIGGPTSNHLRITAAACAWLGLHAYSYVVGNSDLAQGGNLRMLEIVGATICGVPALRSLSETCEHARADFAARCRAAGQRGFFMPFGGATPRGDLGYVVAAREIARQLAEHGRRPKAIYVALGTGGTLAGLAAGAAHYLPDTEVVGYAVMPKGSQVFAGLSSVAAQVARLSDMLGGAKAQFRIEYGQLGTGYAAPTEAAQEAIVRLARSEAIFLDPVYTGKALGADLLGQAKADRFRDVGCGGPFRIDRGRVASAA